MASTPALVHLGLAGALRPELVSQQLSVQDLTSLELEMESTLVHANQDSRGALLTRGVR